jgi:hypothetical protein
MDSYTNNEHVDANNNLKKNDIIRCNHTTVSVMPLSDTDTSDMPNPRSVLIHLTTESNKGRNLINIFQNAQQFYNLIISGSAD